MAKDKFIIEPHFRLQEWVAEEKAIYRDEGLDTVFRELISRPTAPTTTKGDQGRLHAVRSGTRPPLRRGCACHWTVGVAASKARACSMPTS